MTASLLRRWGDIAVTVPQPPARTRILLPSRPILAARFARTAACQLIPDQQRPEADRLSVYRGRVAARFQDGRPRSCVSHDWQAKGGGLPRE